MKQVELLDRIDAVLAAPELPAPAQPEALADSSVRFAGATFSYGSRRVLDGIELSVAPGRCLALVGPSGSGKSTLARLIARFHDVEAGAIQIGGVDVRTIAPDTLNAHVGYVFQDVFLFAGTVAENIRLAKPDATDDEVTAAARAAQAHDFIAAMPDGYDTLIGALQRWSAARLATLFSEDGRWINEVSTFSLNRLFGGLAAGACLLVCVVVFDAVTALCVILAFGLGLAAMPVAGRMLKRLLSARNDEIAGLNQLIGEYGEGIAVFRSFCAGDGAFARLSAAARRMRKLMLDSTPQIVSLQGLAAFAMTLALPFALLAFAWRGEAGLSLWLVPAFFLALAASQALAMAVLPQALVVMLGIQAEANISRFLAEPVLGGHVTEPGRPLALKLDGAHLRYGPGKPDAVSDVSFEVRPGATVAIVGPSGAGKSSLLALMLRFVDPTEGRVFLGSTDLSTLDPARLQALTGFVNQDVHLFRDTLRANLLLGDPQASEDKLKAAIRAARLEELIAALPAGLDTRIGEGGRTLSGGERQRVAVARALLKDAPILLLDEASSAMDPLNERAIQQAISALEDGRTVVVVAHRLRSIAGADQILVMEAGRIVERGRHDELLTLGGLYARLWQAQDRAAGWRLR